MIASSELVAGIEARYRREVLARLTYPQAVAIFTALWQEARALNRDFPTVDWQRDVAADIELARVLNGIPSA